MEQKKVFRSRVSVLVIAFLLLIFTIVFIPMVQHRHYIALLVIAIVLIPFIFFIFAGVRYKISMGKLHISFFGNIRISNIISIKRSYNPLSSPAGSLKRLRIEFWGNEKTSWILISPAREQEFIETLKAINPDIKVNVSNKKGGWRIQDWDI